MGKPDAPVLSTAYGYNNQLQHDLPGPNPLSEQDLHDEVERYATERAHRAILEPEGDENQADREARREQERQAAIKQWMDVVDPSKIPPATPADLALMEAIRDGNCPLACQAIAAGADLLREDKIGRTGLLWAAFYGHADIVDSLLNAGADPSHKAPTDELWNTAQSLATQHGHSKVVDRLLRTRPMGITSVRVNAPSGAPLHVRNQRGRFLMPQGTLGVEYKELWDFSPSGDWRDAVEQQMMRLSQADEDLPSSRR